MKIGKKSPSLASLYAPAFLALVLLAPRASSFPSEAASPAGGTSAGGAATALRDNNAGLFVGIDTFHPSTGCKPLQGCVNDAVLLAHVFVLELRLIAPGRCFLGLGGEPRTEVTARYLKELEAAGVIRFPPTVQAFAEQLLTVNRIPDSTEDMIVVGLSSHGLEKTGQRGLALYDKLIDLGEVRSILKTSLAQKQLIIVDACRSGDFQDPRLPAAVRERLDEELFKGLLAPLPERKTPELEGLEKSFNRARGTAIVFSAELGQSSLDSPYLKHGLLAYFVAQGLRGGALKYSRDGLTTVEGLLRYVGDAMVLYQERVLPHRTGADVQRPAWDGDERARGIPLLYGGKEALLNELIAKASEAYAKATKTFSREDWTAALQSAASVLRLDPQHGIALDIRRNSESWLKKDDEERERRKAEIQKTESEVEALLAKDRFEEAREIVGRLAQIDKQTADRLEGTTRVAEIDFLKRKVAGFLSARDFARAEEAIARLERLDAGLAGYYRKEVLAARIQGLLQVAEEMELSGKFEEAQRALDSVRSLDPQNAVAAAVGERMRLHKEALSAESQWMRSEQGVDKAKLEADGGSVWLQVKAELQAAQGSLRATKYAEATARYHRATEGLERAAKLPGLCEGLRAAVVSRDELAARRLLQDIAALDTEHPLAADVRARLDQRARTVAAREALGRLFEEVKAEEKDLEADGGASWARYRTRAQEGLQLWQTAEGGWKQEIYRSAESTFVEARDSLKSTCDIVAQMREARRTEFSGDGGVASSILEKVLAVDGSHSGARQLLELLKARKRAYEARRSFTENLAKADAARMDRDGGGVWKKCAGQTKGADDLFLKGEQGLDADSFDKALAGYLEATRLLPKAVERASFLSVVDAYLRSRKGAAEALVAAGKMLRLDPEDPQAAELRAQILRDHSFEPSKPYVNTLGMLLVPIGRGSFEMDSVPTKSQRKEAMRRKKTSGNATAGLPATLTQDYHMGAHEITVEQFAKFVEAESHATVAEKQGYAHRLTDRMREVKGMSWRNPGFPSGPSHPVVCVSWDDAAAFTEWLSRLEGRKYRLPTEAEWERAYSKEVAAGERDTRLTRSVANVDGRGTCPVGSFARNDWGLYDMAGNAAEWVLDFYAPYPPGPLTDPKGPEAGDFHVYRGRSWHPSGGNLDYEFRISRDHFDDRKIQTTNYVGFRVVLEH